MSSDGQNGNGHDPDREAGEKESATVLVFRRPVQDNRPPQREPMFNVPPVTKYFILLLAGIHIILQIASPAQKEWVYGHFGFVPGAYTGHAPFTLYAVIAPLTYMLLHGGWMHLIVNVATLAAFGAGVERALGGRKMLILFVLCSLAAIAAQFIAGPFSNDTAIGASGGLSGLFAAVLVMYGSSGRNIMPLVMIMIVIMAVFGSAGIGAGGANVAWVAHIGGFLAGFVLLKPVARMK